MSVAQKRRSVHVRYCGPGLVVCNVHQADKMLVKAKPNISFSPRLKESSSVFSEEKIDKEHQEIKCHVHLQRETRIRPLGLAEYQPMNQFAKEPDRIPRNEEHKN